LVASIVLCAHREYHSQMSSWSFAYFEVNKFVPVSFATIRALDIIPGVAWNTSDTSSRSNNPANLLEWSVTLGTSQSKFWRQFHQVLVFE